MAILSMILFAFLGVCAIVASVRCGKIAIKWINGIFDRIEDRLG